MTSEQAYNDEWHRIQKECLLREGSLPRDLLMKCDQPGVLVGHLDFSVGFALDKLEPLEVVRFRSLCALHEIKKFAEDAIEKLEALE